MFFGKSSILITNINELFVFKVDGEKHYNLYIYIMRCSVNYFNFKIIVIK